MLSLAFENTQPRRIVGQIGDGVGCFTPVVGRGKVVQAAVDHFQRNSRKRLIQSFGNSIRQIDQNSIQQPGSPQLQLDAVLRTDPKIGQAQQPFDGVVSILNGTITNDKFCMSRTGRLTLTWWRRPLRSRSAKTDEGVYPSGEIACRGGIHESSMEGPPPVD
jgi:hypothetical protein